VYDSHVRELHELRESLIVFRNIARDELIKRSISYEFINLFRAVQNSSREVDFLHNCRKTFLTQLLLKCYPLHSYKPRPLIAVGVGWCRVDDSIGDSCCIDEFIVQSQMWITVLCVWGLVSGEKYKSTPGSFFVFDTVGIQDPTFHTNRSKILYKLPALPDWTGLVAFKPQEMLKPFADMTVAVGETPMMGDAVFNHNRILVGHPHVHIASRFVENNASWYFLLEGNDGQWILNGDMVKFSIDVALQHTVEGFVEEWTVPFTAYKDSTRS